MKKSLFYNNILDIINNNNNNLKLKIIFIYNKSLFIKKEYIGYTFFVYNGKIFSEIVVNKKMIGYRFGEFVNTRKLHKYVKKKKNYKLIIIYKSGSIRKIFSLKPKKIISFNVIQKNK